MYKGHNIGRLFILHTTRPSMQSKMVSYIYFYNFDMFNNMELCSYEKIQPQADDSRIITTFSFLFAVQCQIMVNTVNCALLMNPSGEINNC